MRNLACQVGLFAIVIMFRSLKSSFLILKFQKIHNSTETNIFSSLFPQNLFCHIRTIIILKHDYLFIWGKSQNSSCLKIERI